MRRIICTALVALAAAVCGSVCAEELQVVTRDGTRGAILMRAARPRAPTVIVLHGALVTAESTASGYGFGEAAQKYGFAAVFPRGVDMLWNDGRAGAWGSTADDVGFLKRLARDLVLYGVTDPSRLYITGVSNGGMMTLRMLCEASELFAGAGTVIASMPVGTGAICRPRRPVPLIMFNGTADALIPYRGGTVGMFGVQGSVWPVERTARFFARVNGCTALSKSVVAGSADPESIRVVRLDWGQCSSERGVALYRVEGGGHQVYGHTRFVPMFLGPGTNLISAPRRIMAAFARHAY